MPAINMLANLASGLGALKKTLRPPGTIAGRIRQKVSNMPIKPDFTFSPFPT